MLLEIGDRNHRHSVKIRLLCVCSRPRKRVTANLLLRARSAAIKRKKSVAWRPLKPRLQGSGSQQPRKLKNSSSSQLFSSLVVVSPSCLLKSCSHTQSIAAYPTTRCKSYFVDWKHTTPFSQEQGTIIHTTTYKKERKNLVKLAFASSRALNVENAQNVLILLTTTHFPPPPPPPLLLLLLRVCSSFFPPTDISPLPRQTPSTHTRHSMRGRTSTPTTVCVNGQSVLKPPGNGDDDQDSRPTPTTTTTTVLD